VTTVRVSLMELRLLGEAAQPVDAGADQRLHVQPPS
jgi:hypothetical protein